MSKTPRIALFALTGFGNAVLPALCGAGFPPLYVVSRREQGPFPHYPEAPLPELAAGLGIACEFDAAGEARLAADPPEILICATYHRILGADLLKGIAWPVNLHPSLLPHYRGPNPFYWVIRKDERRTGVTAHLMKGATDAGPILWHEALDLAADETQGSLRRRLAAVAARGAVAVVESILRGTSHPMPQDEAAASAFPRPGAAELRLEPGSTVAEAERHIRAASPYPGVVIGEKRVCSVLKTAAREGMGTNDQTISIRLADGEIFVTFVPLNREPAS